MEINWQVEASKETQKKVEETIEAILNENERVRSLVENGIAKIMVSKPTAARKIGKFLLVTIKAAGTILKEMEYHNDEFGFVSRSQEKLKFHIPLRVVE